MSFPLPPFHVPPALAAFATGLVGWFLPTPKALLKGAITMSIPNIEQVQTILNEARDVAKFFLSLVPGAPADKATKILTVIQPAVADELTKLGVSSFVAALVSQLVTLVVNEEVAALAI